jgi:hypothetical protein
MSDAHKAPDIMWVEGIKLCDFYATKIFKSCDFYETYFPKIMWLHLTNEETPSADKEILYL